MSSHILKWVLAFAFATAITTSKVYAASTTYVSSLDLNTQNFQELTQDKTLFLKFYSPTCPHCQKMASEWESFANELRTSKNDDYSHIFIGQVDCTDTSPGGGHDLCDAFQIMGLPSILYGYNDAKIYQDLTLNQYNHEKTHADMNFFLQTHVNVCSPHHLQFCTNDQHVLISQYQQMSISELDDAIIQQEDIIQKKEQEFDLQVTKMTQYFNDLVMEKELATAEFKSQIKLLQSIHDLL